MNKDVEWGPWIAHDEDKMPGGVDGCKVEVRRLDMSTCFLPDGKYDTVVFNDGGDAVWSKTSYTKHIIAYRVKKEPVVEVENRLVNVSGGLMGVSVNAQCTYTDGKLTKIYWEADDAD